ncbi:hypothetical protein ACFX5K_05285 [Rickettsiales bacterium LUAb2]
MKNITYIASGADLKLLNNPQIIILTNKFLAIYGYLITIQYVENLLNTYPKIYIAVECLDYYGSALSMLNKIPYLIVNKTKDNNLQSTNITTVFNTLCQFIEFIQQIRV